MEQIFFSNFSFQIASGKIRNTGNESGVGMLMNLRKIANHPLLIRHHFDNSQIGTLARMLKKDPSHSHAVEKFIKEDLSVMSDFDIHKTCLAYRVIRNGFHVIFFREIIRRFFFSVSNITVLVTIKFVKVANFNSWTIYYLL